MIRIFVAVLVMFTTQAMAETITLASTTSVDNSGLLNKILPVFTRQTGIAVKVIAQGTGQALATATHGDADLVLVHDPDAEAAFVAAGHGMPPREIAWNDFLFVGPPSALVGTHDAQAALRVIASEKMLFVSRGDKSGTDAAEKRLWKKAGINPVGQPWYRDIGGGMGAALNAAAAMDAITLTDRGTWIAFGNKRGLVALVEGDAGFINRYDVIELNPARHPGAKLVTAKVLAEWLAGPEGQREIGAMVLGGEQLFHPDADVPLKSGSKAGGFGIVVGISDVVRPTGTIDGRGRGAYLGAVRFRLLGSSRGCGIGRAASGVRGRRGLAR